jgi:hypothetical protein
VLATFVLATFLFAGEPVAFDADLKPQFTDRQMRRTAHSTRGGFVKWAGTAEGRRLIARFRSAEYEIAVVEDGDDDAPGRAPQPGIATFLAAGDGSKLKRYELILNPVLAAHYDIPDSLDLGEPRSSRDVMAAAWAAEMLHIEFYADGIPLPHHNRDEFQDRWQKVALQLGFPRMRHASEER